MRMLQTLQRTEQRRRRGEMLSSIKPAPGSSLQWTPKRGDLGAPNLPLPRDSSPETKESDGGASRASGGMAPRTVTPVNLPSETGPLERKTERIYIDCGTMRAMQKEVEKLVLPARLSNVCIALRNSDEVLDAHVDAANCHLYENDDMVMKQLEILGEFSKMSLSPTQKLEQHKENLRGACGSLVAEGTVVWIRSWDEAKIKLSKVFIFSKFEMKMPSDFQQRGAAADIPVLSRGGRKPPLNLKSTPKKARTLSPKKPRPKRTPKKSLAEKMSVTVDDFRAQIRRGLGVARFRQIFQQGEILSKTPAIASDEAAAVRLDEKIKRKKSELLSARRLEEILVAKERDDRERDAREAASKLLRPLTPEERSVVDGALRGRGPEAEVLVREGADSVQRGSLRTLRAGQWLNDEVINYFLKNCLAKRDEKLCAKWPGRKRSHFFNSFFVQTMFDEKNNDDAKRGRYSYKNVRRWGKKVPGKDVFGLRYIFCPINLENLHWTSAVIFVEQKRIQYYDSMGGTDWRKLKGLLQYLKDEHKNKKGEELDADEWELVECAGDTPRQRNGFDCGIFTCMYADFISKDCPLVFNQDHIDQCRDRIALSIMKNCAIE